MDKLFLQSLQYASEKNAFAKQYKIKMKQQLKATAGLKQS